MEYEHTVCRNPYCGDTYTERISNRRYQELTKPHPEVPRARVSTNRRVTCRTCHKRQAVAYPCISSTNILAAMDETDDIEEMMENF